MGDRRYRAFVSYSHADEAWGSWLQRSLERFRAPPALAAVLEARGNSPRLGPIFRDREDLPVAGSLNDAIQAALADSEFQIVLCSPAAAKSRWVNEEIRLFHKLHGPGRLYALIIAGEPNASAIAGREDEECFPPALRFLLDEEGAVTQTAAEPLAADAREDGDGKRYALLKVAAGMLGVGLDDLVRRDAARRTRLAWTVAGGSIAGVVVAGALAFTAVVKSREAAIMRGKAENLIEFMLTDLRDRLEKVGRLDVLESVGDRAMAYYADQNLKMLDDETLARRAKAMLLLGSIDFRRNDLTAAEEAYTAAEAATGELLRRAPNSADRIFEHAQSVFYVGSVGFSRRDIAAAERQYLEYLRLAQQLVALDNRKPAWRLELAYATSNVGSTKLEAGNFEEASAYFSKSIEARRLLSEAEPSDTTMRFAYAYALSWQAYAELLQANYRAAIGLIRRQLSIYGEDGGTQSEDYAILDAVVTAERRLGEAHLWLGEIDEARAAFDKAAGTANRLISRDNGNANWNINASHIARQQSALLLEAGDKAAAAAAADRALAHATAAANSAQGGEWYAIVQGLALAHRMSIGDNAENLAADADQLRPLLAASLRKDVVANGVLIAQATEALARYERTNGRDEIADQTLAAGIETLEAAIENMPVSTRMYLAALYVDAGALEKAASIIDILEARGLAHPDFKRLRRSIRKLANN